MGGPLSAETTRPHRKSDLKPAGKVDVCDLRDSSKWIAAETSKSLHKRLVMFPGDLLGT